MARTQAYPVELVQNFSDAIRHSRLRQDAIKPPAPTDMMILRALLAHPLVDRPARHVEPAENAASAAPLH